MWQSLLSRYRGQLVRWNPLRRFLILGRWVRIQCRCGYRGFAEKIREGDYRCPKCRAHAAHELSRGAIAGWILVYLWIIAVLASQVAPWASHHDAAWGGIGGELLGYLPIAMLFGPPVLALYFLWRWMEA
jgi:hypothetical protein